MKSLLKSFFNQLSKNSSFLGLLLTITLIFGFAMESDAQTITITTNKGLIEVQLDAAKAPGSVKNFMTYISESFFDGTIFHRVIPGFMIQGGGFTSDMKQKSTHPAIKIESSNGLHNERGTIAMARTNDPNSATSQFFINLADNGFLDFRDPSPQGIGYTVFGKVTKGMDVVDQIAKVKTGRKGMFDDVPLETVTIESIKENK